MPSRTVNRLLCRRAAALVVAALLVAPQFPATAAPPEPGAPPPPKTCRIEGRVFGADGRTPVTGAVVVASPLQEDRTYESSPTDAKGGFVIEGIPFGYVDLGVRASDGLFVGNQVVNLPPASTIAITFNLTRYEERSQAWWADHARPESGGGPETSIGVAEVETTARGREFWRSPKGIAIIAGIGGAAILAAALGGGSDGGSGTVASQSLP